ncbi:uncharacterized protein SCHCODRAFT_02562919 [Schizophyllum commune H4-8]|nr:uncharacterized protein SCHCODRAFT_02562919 [Schizophyllum commune H4-8]KAI5900380.1 hypothetical protein SCHCODRAFT_02562919 [Schizophyllum commune H4-8]
MLFGLSPFSIATRTGLDLAINLKTGLFREDFILTPAFARSRTYARVLRHLDPALIPDHDGPFTNDEWDRIFRGIDAACSLADLMRVVRDNTDPKVRTKYTNELIPRVWPWLRFLFDYTKTPRSADRDLVTVAKQRHGWDIYLGRCSQEGVLMFIDLLLYVLSSFPEGRAAMRAQGDWAEIIYDMWRISTTTTYKNCDPDILLSISLESVIGTIVSTHEDMRPDFQAEVLARGLATGRHFARRLQDLIDAPQSVHKFEEIAMFIQIVVWSAYHEGVRPLFRPLLFVMPLAMTAIDLPDASTPSLRLRCMDGYDMRDRFTGHCVTVFNYLRVNVEGKRDIVKLMRSPLLRAMYRTLIRFPGGPASGNIANALEYFVKPALIFPSVIKAVVQTAERDKLNLNVTGIRGFESWNVMGALVRERSDMLTSVTKSLEERHCCHNKKCDQEYTELKRCPCGDAFYCSTACQRAHRYEHRLFCQPIVLGPAAISLFDPSPVGPSVALPTDVFDRHSDWYFIRHISQEDARRTLDQKGSARLAAVDYTGYNNRKRVTWKDLKLDIKYPDCLNDWLTTVIAVGGRDIVMHFGAVGRCSDRVMATMEKAKSEHGTA